MKTFSEYNSLGKKIGGFILFGLGLLLLVLLIIYSLRDFPIWFIGKHVPGIVEETGYEVIKENKGELSFTYSVTYTFIGPNGETITGNSSLAAQEWSALSAGQEVEVVYSPLDPSNNRIDDSRYLSILLCSYVPIIFLCWLLLYAGWNILYAEFKNYEPAPWIVKKGEDL